MEMEKEEESRWVMKLELNHKTKKVSKLQKPAKTFLIIIELLKNILFVLEPIQKGYAAPFHPM